MEQEAQSDSQESVQFGEVDPTAQQVVLNDSSDDSQPLMGQQTSTNSRTQQQQSSIVNYGPCIMCNVNERCVLFVGCNHLACCGQCSTTCIDICPVPDCNHPITGRLHVYKP